jgi:molybdopterin molybdotransferase
MRNAIDRRGHGLHRCGSLKTWYIAIVLAFDDALTRILSLASPLETEACPIEDADRRVLSEDVVAPCDVPRFDYSAMDGYAVRVSDLAGTSRLHVEGEARTGAVSPPLRPGTAMRIFTGAEIPRGADAVVMQENVTRDGSYAAFASAPSPGLAIRRKGEDLAKGTIALRRGVRLRPSHLALAASLDLRELPVARRPVVAFLATGDELRKPGTEARPGTVPESNTVALRAMARRAGAVARALPFVKDERTATESAFSAALDEADVLVTVGGVSVGDHDLVKPALEAVGVTLDFWKVAMKPGKPLVVGRCSGHRASIVLGLPGNPASALVTFALFGVPLLRALQGDPSPFPRARRAVMKRPFRRDAGRTEFARAKLAGADVETFANQSSGALTTMAEADALVKVPAEQGEVPEGAEVEVLATDDLGV